MSSKLDIRKATIGYTGSLADQSGGTVLNGSQNPSPKANRIVALAVGAIALFLLVLAALWLFDKLVEPPRPAETALTTDPPKRTETAIIDAADVHIRRAVEDARAAVQTRAAEFQSFLEENKTGAAPFSKEVLSWYGKWRTIKPYLPFTESDSHRIFIEEMFATHLFSTEEVNQRLIRTVEDVLRDIQEIENRLAVQLHGEIHDAPLTPRELTMVRQEFAAGVERIIIASQWETGKAGARFVLAEVVAIVGGQIIVRLAVTGGLLAAGASNAGWSLGASIIVALIADAVWDWLTDPAGNIERELLTSIDELSVSANEAIRIEFDEIIAQRAGLWTRQFLVMLW